MQYIESLGNSPLGYPVVFAVGQWGRALGRFAHAVQRISIQLYTDIARELELPAVQFVVATTLILVVLVVVHEVRVAARRRKMLEATKCDEPRPADEDEDISVARLEPVCEKVSPRRRTITATVGAGAARRRSERLRLKKLKDEGDEPDDDDGEE